MLLPSSQIILIIAAVISLALGLYQTFGQAPEVIDGNTVPSIDWVEGVAIMVAVAIVVLVGATNDWQKEKQFQKLNAKKEDRGAKVIRDGKEQIISVYVSRVSSVPRSQSGSDAGSPSFRL